MTGANLTFNEGKLLISKKYGVFFWGDSEVLHYIKLLSSADGFCGSAGIINV